MASSSPAEDDQLSGARAAWQAAVKERRHAEMYTGHGNTRRVETYKREADAAGAYIRALEEAGSIAAARSA